MGRQTRDWIYSQLEDRPRHKGVGGKWFRVFYSIAISLKRIADNMDRKS